MYEWYINEWVHLMVLNPATNEFLYFSKGSFHTYNPLMKSIPGVQNVSSYCI
jgi:hypothetical protein